MPIIGYKYTLFYNNQPVQAFSDEYVSEFAFDRAAQGLDIPNGYVFEGWYTTETFEEGTKVTGDYYLTQETNFYARIVERPTVKSKMTAIADEIRELSGATDLLDLDEMAAHIDDANVKINGQATTIAEISALLDGKSVPGGGSSGGNVQTCTVVMDETTCGFSTIIYSICENGDVVCKSTYNNAFASMTLNAVVKNTPIIIYPSNAMATSVIGGNSIGSKWLSDGQLMHFITGTSDTVNVSGSEFEQESSP